MTEPIDDLPRRLGGSRLSIGGGPFPPQLVANFMKWCYYLLDTYQVSLLIDEPFSDPVFQLQGD